MKTIHLIFIMSIFGCLCSCHTSEKCGKYYILQDDRMVIDTVITFDPEDYSEELWVGKSYRDDGIEYSCHEVLDNGERVRNFAEINGKLYLVSDIKLIHKTEGMKSGKKMK